MKIYPLVDIEEGIKGYKGTTILDMTNGLLRNLNKNGTISVECPVGSKRNPPYIPDNLIHQVKYGAINYLIVPDHPRYWAFNTSWPPPTTKSSTSGRPGKYSTFYYYYYTEQY